MDKALGRFQSHNKTMAISGRKEPARSSHGWRGERHGPILQWVLATHSKAVETEKENEEKKN